MSKHLHLLPLPQPPPNRTARDMEPVYAQTRVVKRLSASQSGAIKLARRFGDALVCVRYRRDMEGLIRYTTVELVVDRVPVVTRKKPDSIVTMKIEFDDSSLRQLMLAHGARWDARKQVWRMTLLSATKLGLEDRIV